MAWLAILFMGVVLGLIGGGGGILTVPTLTGLLGFDVVEATGASLFVVGVASLFGAVSAALKGEVEFRRALPLAAASIIGSFASRRFLVPALPATIAGLTKGTVLMILFAVLMVIVGVRMLRPTSPSQPAKGQANALKSLGAGLAIGLLASTLGASGGFLILPALILFLGLEMKPAVSTSLMVIALQSLAGFAGELGQPVNWGILLPITGVAIVGMGLGTLLRGRFDGEKLRKGFGVTVMAVAGIVTAQVLMNRF